MLESEKPRVIQTHLVKPQHSKATLPYLGYRERIYRSEVTKAMA